VSRDPDDYEDENVHLHMEIDIECDYLDARSC